MWLCTPTSGFKGRISVSTGFSTEESLISASTVPAASKSPKKRTKSKCERKSNKNKVCVWRVGRGLVGEGGGSEGRWEMGGGRGGEMSCLVY